MAPKIEPVILVHGGAGAIPNSRVSAKLDGVRIAARRGYKKFLETDDILAGCIRAVQMMEEDENFNAGRGSVLTEDGVIEMEALVMEGAKLKAGAVTCLRNVGRPIDVARLVMDKTPHVLLGGKPVKQFATQHGIPAVEDVHLYTRAAKEALEHFQYEHGEPSTTEIGPPEIGTQFRLRVSAKVVGRRCLCLDPFVTESFDSAKESSAESKSGETVGAIGIDCNGHVVCCVSTGGITGKMTGRIGDTPIPGAGGYADDEIGTVCTTGNGDAILRYNLASRIMNLMDLAKKNAQQATETAVNGLTARTTKTAGAITLSKTGDVGISFTSKRMSWAYIKGGKLHFGIEKGDDNVEDV